MSIFCSPGVRPGESLITSGCELGLLGYKNGRKLLRECRKVSNGTRLRRKQKQRSDDTDKESDSAEEKPQMIPP